MIRSLVITYSILVLVTSTALSRELPEEEYLASFRAGHPARAALAEITERARANLRTASLLDNPLGSFEREAPEDIGQNTWSLSWTPPFDGRRSARKGAARAALESAEYERALADADLRSHLREAYASWALTSERTSILELYTRRLKDLVTRVSHRARSGEESQLSARRIMLAVLEIEAATARSDVERMETKSDAIGWLSIDEDVTPARPPLPEENVLPQADETLAVGFRRANVKAAQATATWSGRYFQIPELMFGWQTISQDETEQSGPVMGVTLALPLFDRRQGDRDNARAALSAENARLELESRRVSARLAVASDRYQRLRTAAMSTMDSLSIAEDVLKSAAARFEAGESDVTELLETVRGILSARVAALELYADALTAHRELERLIGRSWPVEEE